MRTDASGRGYINILTSKRLIASPLDRARQSAEIIAETTGFPKGVTVDDGFIERDCGALEGAVWRPGLDPEDPGCGMETRREVCERAERALGKYAFAEDERIMIVSHGAMLAALRTVLSDYKLDYWDRTVPVVQGNILCCVKDAGKETEFYNLF